MKTFSSNSQFCIFFVLPVLIVIIFPLVEAQTDPVITSVSDITANKHQTITITGNGFGNQMPYTNGDSSYIEIQDKTRNWNAGNSNNPANLVTLDVSKWTDSQIVITGFDGSYGNDWSLNYGDTVNVYVFNIPTNKWLQYVTTVSMDRNTVPTFDFKDPIINGLSISLAGVFHLPNAVDKSIIDWGDGTSSISWQNGQQIPNSWIHTYSQGGTYVIKYTLTDINGLSGSATQTVNLQQQGQSYSQSTQQSSSQSSTEYLKTDKTEYVVSATNSVQANIYGMVGNSKGGYVNLTLIQPDGTAESLSGYVKGDGSFTLPLVLDTRSQTGMYQVKADYQGSSVGSTSFTVTAGVVGQKITKTASAQGTVSTSTQNSPITISMDLKTSGLTVKPQGTINDPPATSFTINWIWGDGQQKTTTNADLWPSHQYASGASYPVTVKVVDNLGNMNSLTSTVNLQGEPVQTKQCYDGTVIPITSTCPTPPHYTSSTNASTTPIAPSSPTDFTANIVEKHIYLSWKPSASDGGSAITEYIIMRDTTPDPQKILDTVTGVINSYEDNTIISNQHYYYQVIAKNSIGQSDPISTDIISPNISPAPLYEDPAFLAILGILGIVVPIVLVIIQRKKKQP